MKLNPIRGLIAVLFVGLGFSSAILKAHDSQANAGPKPVGAVYILSNISYRNSVLIYNRSANGELSPGGVAYTGGLGSGGVEPDFGLGNSGAMVMSADKQFLFVVNPGSDDVSVFAIKSNGLKLLDRKSSGGYQPISITINGTLIYVLNAGGNIGASDNISALVVDAEGIMTPLPKSTQPLSGDVTSPAEIKFQPGGHVLVVSEKNTNAIDTYVVNADGRARPPSTTVSDA